jgi:hypothetical protein
MSKIKITLAALTAVMLLALSSLALAQNTPSGSGLSISPTLSELTMQPGGSDHVSITLKNITVDDVIAKGIVNDFKSDNSSGEPQIITDPNQTTPNSIKKFVSNIDDVPLAKGQQKNIVLGIDVPKDTPPGAYYGIIRYRAIPSSLATPGPGQVALTASVGTIVLITVPGDVHEQVQVKGIHVYRGARESSFFIKPPNKVGITISNLGNGFVKPFGTVEVSTTLNKDVATFQFNNPKQLGNILPHSTRTFSSNVKNISKIGHYTVLASVSYGSGSQVLPVKKDFWYIPLWLVIIVLLIIAGLVFFVYRSWRRYGRDRRHSFRK